MHRRASRFGGSAPRCSPAYGPPPLTRSRVKLVGVQLWAPQLDEARSPSTAASTRRPRSPLRLSAADSGAPDRRVLGPRGVDVAAHEGAGSASALASPCALCVALRPSTRPLAPAPIVDAPQPPAGTISRHRRRAALERGLPQAQLQLCVESPAGRKPSIRCPYVPRVGPSGWPCEIGGDVSSRT